MQKNEETSQRWPYTLLLLDPDKAVVAVCDLSESHKYFRTLS